MFIPLVLEGPSSTPVVRRIDYVREGFWREVDRPEMEKPEGVRGSAPPVERIAGFLRSCLDRNIRLLEEGRRSWLEWCDGRFQTG